MGAFAQLPVNFYGDIPSHLLVSMGAFAQLPVNNGESDWCRYNWFQWAPLPNSLSTLISILMKIQMVSMGAFAQLPVNSSASGSNAGSSFNGRLCPTPCQRIRTLFQFTCRFNGRLCPTPCQHGQGIDEKNLVCFNGRLCPTPCQLQA